MEAGGEERRGWASINSPASLYIDIQVTERAGSERGAEPRAPRSRRVYLCASHVCVRVRVDYETSEGSCSDEFGVNQIIHLLGFIVQRR